MPFVKGKSGNPGGRPKKTEQEFDLISACRQKAPDALAVIENIMVNGESERVRLSAAIAIIERAYGSVAAINPAADDPVPSRVDVARTDASIPEA